MTLVLLIYLITIIISFSVFVLITRMHQDIDGLDFAQIIAFSFIPVLNIAVATTLILFHIHDNVKFFRQIIIKQKITK